MTEPRCGEPMYTIYCDLPTGHGGDEHHGEWALPPEVNAMLAQAMDQADEMARHYRIARRWSWATVGIMAAAAGIYLFLILSHL